MPISTPVMTIGLLRDLIRDLPDSALVEITNLSGAEWYGIEPLHPGSVEIIGGKLIIEFGNSNQPISYAYKRQLEENVKDEMEALLIRVRNYIIDLRKSEKYSDCPIPNIKDV